MSITIINSRSTLLVLKYSWMALMFAMVSGCVSVSRTLTTDLSPSSIALADLDQVDAKLIIQDVVIGRGENGEIDLSEFAKLIYEKVAEAGGFLSVSRSSCVSGYYALTPVVVKLTDLFDNVIHLRIQVKNCQNDRVIYDNLFVGSAFTQKHSMSVTTKLLIEKIPKIRSSIDQDIKSSSIISPND